MIIDETEAVVPLEFSKVTIHIANDVDGEKISIDFVIQETFPWNLFQFDSEVRQTKYTFTPYRIWGWRKTKALIRCALFGHLEDLGIIMPIFVKPKWHQLKARVNYCGRCHLDFRKGD